MTIEKTVSLFAVILGFFGSIFLAKGILYLTPDIMAGLSRGRWGYHTLQLENIASQKADFMCGVWLIVLAFFIQVMNQLFTSDVEIFENRWVGASIVGATALLIVGLFGAANVPLKKKYDLQGRRVIASDRLQNIVTKEDIDERSFQSVVTDADNLLNFLQEQDESPEAFIERYADHLNVDLPDSLKVNIDDPVQ